MKPTRAFTSLVVTSVIASQISAQAASITVGASAPVADNEDIYSFAASGLQAGNITGSDLTDYPVGGGPDGAPDMDSLWRDRGAQGQTFTTGNHAQGYLLDSFSFKVRIANPTAGDAAITTFRLGTVSEVDSKLVFTELASAQTRPDAYLVTGDWLTASFDSSVLLSAGTMYAVDFQNTETATWYGYYLDGDVASSYTDGYAYTSGLKNQGLEDNNLRLPNIDRAFHVNLVAAVPEPSSSVMLGVAGMVLTLRRRR